MLSLWFFFISKSSKLLKDLVFCYYVRHAWMLCKIWLSSTQLFDKEFNCFFCNISFGDKKLYIYFFLSFKSKKKNIFFTLNWSWRFEKRHSDKMVYLYFHFLLFFFLFFWIISVDLCWRFLLLNWLSIEDTEKIDWTFFSQFFLVSIIIFFVLISNFIVFLPSWLFRTVLFILDFFPFLFSFFFIIVQFLFIFSYFHQQCAGFSFIFQMSCGCVLSWKIAFFFLFSFLLIIFSILCWFLFLFKKRYS